MLRFSFNLNSTPTPSECDSEYESKADDADLAHHELEGFSVSTDVDFLYQIGKICAENGKKLKEGINSLNDFCLILDYYNEDMDAKVYK
jgi:hypothetical protein